MLRDLIYYLKKNNKSNIVPINDISAYIKYPKYNYIYNKLFLANLQNLKAAPLPIYPLIYPVIIKPIYNLYGMSKGFKIIKNVKEFEENVNLIGYFWEEYIPGSQYNLDIILKDGKIIDYFALRSEANKDGTFKYHQYIKDYNLNQNIINLLERILKDYTGVINVEIIKDNIIEMHLRFNGDFFIYGEDFIKAFIKFMETGTYEKNFKIRELTFFPIFSKKNINLENKIKKYKDIFEYKIDNFESNYQGDNLKRIAMFTINDFKKGRKIQKRLSTFLKNIPCI